MREAACRREGASPGGGCQTYDARRQPSSHASQVSERHFTNKGLSLLLEMAAIVCWSTLRWACTSSGGVSASH